MKWQQYFWQTPTRYRQIQDEELLLSSDSDEKPPSSGAWRSRKASTLLTLVICGATLLLHLGFLWWTGKASELCSHPATRREWRSLSRSEKKEYIAAVNCLRMKPSRITTNRSLYDDFPHVHSTVGGYCQSSLDPSSLLPSKELFADLQIAHEAAPFLVWHRLFIHTFETALRQECDYRDHLPYWDWTLDWENLAEAPIWDDEYGFGKNGDPSSSEEVLGGYCVRTGPFANLQVLLPDAAGGPHCLSRGIGTGLPLEELSQWIRPSKIDQVLELSDFAHFYLQLENTAHNAIPSSIRGDFSAFTAPYDPVFYLHHAQLDRLWTKWQSLDVENRRNRYHGAAAHNSSVRANPDDLVLLGGLTPDVKAAELLDTRKGPLCYVY